MHVVVHEHFETQLTGRHIVYPRGAPLSGHEDQPAVGAEPAVVLQNDLSPQLAIAKFPNGNLLARLGLSSRRGAKGTA